jgi:hypothetical protein
MHLACRRPWIRTNERKKERRKEGKEGKEGGKKSFYVCLPF